MEQCFQNIVILRGRLVSISSEEDFKAIGYCKLVLRTHETWPDGSEQFEDHDVCFRNPEWFSKLRAAKKKDGLIEVHGRVRHQLGDDMQRRTFIHANNILYQISCF